MGKKTTDLATSQLMTYQQVLGMSNEQMDRFATDMETFLKEKKISQNFYDTIIRELQPKVEANNKILSDIERTLFDRVNKDFPSGTTPNVIGRYMKRYHEEIASQKKINDDVMKSVIEKGKDAKVVKPNFKVEE